MEGKTRRTHFQRAGAKHTVCRWVPGWQVRFLGSASAPTDTKCQRSTISWHQQAPSRASIQNDIISQQRLQPESTRTPTDPAETPTACGGICHHPTELGEVPWNILQKQKTSRNILKWVVNTTPFSGKHSLKELVRSCGMEHTFAAVRVGLDNTEEYMDYLPGTYTRPAQYVHCTFAATALGRCGAIEGAPIPWEMTAGSAHTRDSRRGTRQAKYTYHCVGTDDYFEWRQPLILRILKQTSSVSE